METVTEKIIYDAGKMLEQLLKGNIPAKINPCEYETRLERDFAEVANSLVESFDEIRRFIIPLSRGQLQDFTPNKNNYLASPFKELAAQLKHLNWQTSRIAEGDYGQRVEFMGEFSAAFNSMIDKLQQREEQLKLAKEHLEEKVRERTKDIEEMVEQVYETNEELKEFIYIASHDLREPLRRISAFGDLLSESIGEQLGYDDKENLELMLEGTANMRRMVEGLLAYSKLTSTKTKFTMVDLNEVVAYISEYRLRKLLKDTKGQVIVPNKLHTIRGNSQQINELLFQLISNGLKYHKKDEKVCLTISSKKSKQGMVYVEVVDNGIGIKQEQLTKIFGMFKRLHLRENYDGTGIGLTLCRRIVNLHNGDIGANSTYGQGSTFWFTIPDNQ